MKTISINFFALVAISLLASCTGQIKPISSNPPAAKLRVNKPFSCGDGVILIKVNMPKGIYTPKFEDKNGYYYDAPQRLTSWETFYSTMPEGGLYVEKGASLPEKIYVIRDYGIPAKLNISQQTDITVLRK